MEFVDLDLHSDIFNYFIVIMRLCVCTGVEIFIFSL